VAAASSGPTSPTAALRSIHPDAGRAGATATEGSAMNRLAKICCASPSRCCRARVRRAQCLCDGAGMGALAEGSGRQGQRSTRPTHCRIRITSRRSPASSRARRRPGCSTGAELEINCTARYSAGRKSKVQPANRIPRSHTVRRHPEKPARLDRADGDVHRPAIRTSRPIRATS
jgi:hypothetical protein